MNLDELRSVQAKERRKDSLQHLRDAFYDDVAAYVADLRAARDRRAQQVDNPFSDDDVRRLSDEVETAEEVSEALYERRVGKVVKLASFAAADMPVETEGMTAEERALFDDLVERIESNKSRVLDVLAGEAPPESAATESTAVDSGGPDSAAAGASPVGPEAEAGGRGSEAGPDPTPVDNESDVLAGAMGGGPADRSSGRSETESQSAAPADPGTDPNGGANSNAGTDSDSESERGATDPEPGRGATDGGPTPVEPDSPPPGAPGATDPRGANSAGETTPTPSGSESTPSDSEPTPSGSESTPTNPPAGETHAGPATQESQTAADDPGATDTVDRETVRITRDVGAILGVDEREYDLASDDVVTLPAENAEPLVKRDAAERIE